MMNDSLEKIFIVLAKRVPGSWLQVVEQFNPADGDITYPYMRAACAAASARSTAKVEYVACQLLHSLPNGRQFAPLAEGATIIDGVMLAEEKQRAERVAHLHTITHGAIALA